MLSNTRLACCFFNSKSRVPKQTRDNSLDTNNKHEDEQALMPPPPPKSKSQPSTSKAAPSAPSVNDTVADFGEDFESPNLNPVGFRPKAVGGHVFITQGYVSEVACDAFWVTCDENLDIDATWMEVLGDQFIKSLPPLPHAWKTQEQRVLAVPPRNPNSTRWRGKQWSFLVNFRGVAIATGDVDPVDAVLMLYEKVILEFVEQVVRLVGNSGMSLFGRPKKLIGIPLAGTSSSSKSPLKDHVGRAIQKILPILHASAAKYDIDFILGTGSGKPKYAAVQSARARNIDIKEFTDFLSPALMEHGTRLARLAARGELALFVGSGVGVGCGLPLWKDLLHGLAVEVGMNAKEVAEIDTMNSLDAAKIIEKRFPSRGALVSRVAQALGSDHYSLTHSLLAALPCKEVITTNYDTSFERASWDIGIKKLAVIPYYPRIDCERWLLKMHGCVTSPGDIVLTREDYIRYSEKNQALSGIVQSILIQKHMLFVGFSLVDDNFHKIMDAVRRISDSRLDLDNPKIRADIARAYSGGSDKQNSLAQRLKFEGEDVKSGTILSLFPHPLMDAYWGEMFDLLNMTSAELTKSNKSRLISESVRILEIFLDYITYELCKLTTVENLLLPHFENTLDAEERLCRYAVLGLVESFPKDALNTLAWEKIKETLRGMGGKEIIKSREAVLTSRRGSSAGQSFEAMIATDLMSLAVLKIDHFENIHQLKDAQIVIHGAPNFRKVPGFPVFGTGQPTFEGLTEMVRNIRDQHGFPRVLWMLLRQEPIIYINGKSFAPRRRQALNENMNFPNATPALLATLQEDLVRAVRNRLIANDNVVWYFRDTFALHPDDRKNVEYSVKTLGPAGVMTAQGVVGLCRSMGFDVLLERLPIVDEAAPALSDFDSIVSHITSQKNTITAFLFNCQMGKGRTTCGMISACLLLSALGLGSVPQSTTPNTHQDKALFAPVKKLLETDPLFETVKDHVDEIVDLCGPPSGLQNLRECIAWAKANYEKATTEKQHFWLRTGRNFVQRYMTLLSFGLYTQTQQPNFTLQFSAWMNKNTVLKSACLQELGDWEWE